MAEMEASESVGGRVFADAASRVVSRLVVCHWVNCLRRTVVPIMVAGLVVLLGARLWWGGEGNVFFAVLCIAVWLGGTAAWVMSRRPASFQALALWDERAHRHEAFASAMFFEGKAEGDLSAGELVHLRRCEGQLGSALEEMRGDLPVQGLGWRWMLPLGLVVFSLSSWMEPAALPGDAALTEAMQERAREEAATLEMDPDSFEKMASLREKEKEDIRKLTQDIGLTADGLREGAEKTAREVLRELEARAREAEKLAERMGNRGEEWASQAMLEEMGQHVDTAELAAFLKDKKAEPAADEAEQLSVHLESEDLGKAERARMKTALNQIMTRASDEDHQRPVGRHFGEAAVDMRGERAAEAGREFQKLAEHFRQLGERERAKEKLKEMAEKLRESGANIAGEGLGAMQKLAAQEGRAREGQTGTNASAAPMPNMTPMTGKGGMSNEDGAAGGASMPTPGRQSQEDLGKGQQGVAPLGAQGEGEPGKSMGFVPGGSGGTDVPAIFAPIPGMNLSGGGPQAGHGTAPLEGGETGAMKSAQSGLVAAQVNRQGESSVRAVEGGQRTEEAERDTTDQIVEFIKVEEEALDGQPLPASRKEHILRYFTALRERFEESDGE